jgi:hypothetical protein
LTRKTNQRTEIDKRRIVNPGGVPWNKGARVFPKCFPTSRSIYRAAEIKQTRQNASSVGFDDRDGPIKGECCNGIGSVTADAGQCSHRRETEREPAAGLVLHGYRNRVQIARPRVITQALPCVQDVAFGSPSQRAEIGEAPEPVIIIRDNRGNLRLLEHDLGDEDGVGVASLAPRKNAALLVIPVRERRLELIFSESHREARINTDD